MITFLEEISGFPEYYASEEGFITNEKGEPYESFRGEDGYCRVNIGEETLLVHKVIANAFVKGKTIGKIGVIVYHKNWDRSDNRPENLEWREKEVSNGVKCGVQRLCNDIECVICYNKSFASSDKVKLWSLENKLTPREVLKCSVKNIKFDCGCGHSFDRVPAHIKGCPYCSFPPKELCNDEKCTQCYNKSFASSDKALFWSKENKLTPREVFIQSNKKYNFDCECGHRFESVLGNITKGAWCPYCSGNKKLCNDEKCTQCYNRSFASSDKAKYWSKENKLTPREVFKSSHIKYKFDCDCDHRFVCALTDIKSGNWCPYCSNNKLCDDMDCVGCLHKSFASSDKALFWSKENKLTPREVFIQSNKKYNFDCECGHQFESIASNIFMGNWCPYCNSDKLCNEENCIQCYNKSFASSHKAKYWSGENKESPREVCCRSNKKYKFDCECGHQFQSTLTDIKSGNWCPYCSHKKLCDNDQCDSCYNKSFMASDKIEYWSKDNEITPRQVFKYSHKLCKFDWKCGHQTTERPDALRKSNNCTKCDSCPSCQLWLTRGHLCAYCKPKSQNKLYQKTKEMEVVKFLKANLPDKEFIHNKSVSSDCTGTHLFPDVLFDCNFYYLIVEIDEHKHRGANYNCEEKRMRDIIAKAGLPCIFIRYNPDSKLSDKMVLLDRVNYYLELDDCEKKEWDDFGFKDEYLFY